MTVLSIQSQMFKKNPCYTNNRFKHQQPQISVSTKLCFSKSPAMSHALAAQPQKLIVPNDQNEKLVGLLHDTGSKEIVVLCHGFKSSKEQQTMVNHSVALADEGISAFRFDFSGNGESDGSFAYGNYMKEVEDLSAVVKYFKDINRSVSAIVGHSKGGDVVLLYASKYHDVRTVVNISGRYDLKKGISERLGEDFMERLEKDGYIDVKSKTGQVMYRVTLESLMARLNTDMHEASLKIDKHCRGVKSKHANRLTNNNDFNSMYSAVITMMSFYPAINFVFVYSVLSVKLQSLRGKSRRTQCHMISSSHGLVQ